MPLLPHKDEHLRYRYPDGCMIWRSHTVAEKWMANWSDGTVLKGYSEQAGMEVTSYFDTPEDAARALLEGGEGPASLPQPIRGRDLA